MDVPLTDADIRRLLGANTRVITYPELAGFRSLDELLDENGRAVILFLTDPARPNSGHWIGLFTRPDGAIETFDSYGMPLDASRRWLKPDELAALGESKPLLTNLLKLSGRRVYVSRMPLQGRGRGIATCGKWLVMRMLLANMPDYDFHEFARSNPVEMAPDAWVSMIVDTLLQRYRDAIKLASLPLK